MRLNEAWHSSGVASSTAYRPLPDGLTATQLLFLDGHTSIYAELVQLMELKR